MLHASIIWRKEWGWGDQAEQLLITETNFNKHKQFEQTYIISSSPCMLDSLYFMQDRICWTNWLQLFIQSTHADSLCFMQDRICWTNWLQLFIQSMHAWLTLFYAGQNLLNDLSLQLLCLLLQAHRWDCGYCMTPSSCCEKERFGFFSPVFGFFSPIFSITLPSFKPIAMMGFFLSSPSNLLPWWGNCYHHPLTLCHDGKIVIITL